MAQPSFHIYHASAGSGKTFTLVKSYLKQALEFPGKRGFRKLLALTFTNKAVNEMKVRILRSLNHFAQSPIPASSQVLFQQLQEELNLPEERLRERSAQLLKEILHNYAFFDISTIDRFNHRLIRTFSKDLGLPHSFEVLLDENMLVEEAVDRLLDRSGTSEALTDFLIAYTLQHIEDDRSWDIRWALTEQGQLLFKENHQGYLRGLAAWTFEDLRKTEKSLRAELARLNEAITQKGSLVMEYLEQHDLKPDYFPRKTLPNHFTKIRQGDRNYRSLYTNKLSDQLDEGNAFNASMPLPQEEHILFLQTEYNRCRSLIMRYNFLRNALNNLLPLTVLNAINLEIEALMKEKNWLPIGAFNTLISEQIREQPTPFIYERIGEIYRHFFLDEFQDTSVIQWQNLIPLISGSLSSSDSHGASGSLMLVGDAKQAIYRWRGGRAEQFLQLITGRENPFYVAPDLYALDTNYRSAAEIIRFNNSFFKSTSTVLQDDDFRELFHNQVEQRFNKKEGGYVQLRFLSPVSDSVDADYEDAVLNCIHEVRNSGYAYKDICILVRNNKHALVLAAALSTQGIPLVSPESLLLKANRGVQFLIHLLRFLSNPEDRGVRFELLFHLAGDNTAKHDFIAQRMDHIEELLTSQYGFVPETMRFLSLFDICSQAVRQFKLDVLGPSYLQFFLDEVQDQEGLEGTDIRSFLEYWEVAQNKLGIPAPEGWDAIRIMTIHKAKGLEFPIVIYPYANTRVYAESRPKIWVSSDDKTLGDFKYILLDKRTEMQEYSEAISIAYKEEQHRLELDAFNVLYVAMTRAVEGLYVLCNTGRKKREEANSYNELFEDYVKDLGRWEEGKTLYEWGSLNAQHGVTEEMPHQWIPFRYSSKDETYFKTVVTSGLIWEPEIEKAQEYGQWVHQLLSEVYLQDDVDRVIDKAEKRGELDTEALMDVTKLLGELVHHKEIGKYFSEEYEIRNEQSILTPNAVVLRPDRIMIKDGKAHIIDYKTGEERDSYAQQLHTYAAVLEQMGYAIGDKILIYLSDKINVKFI